MKIPNRLTNVVIFADEQDSMAKTVKAALSDGADLRNADLHNANLSDANLSCADLHNANLSDANLSGADLSCADLRNADLSDANLSGANLSGADLRCANLSCANLSCADLRCADLSCADLSYADLSDANLSGANLSGAILNWNSHELLSKILFNASGNDSQKRMLAGLILVSKDWCWNTFTSLTISKTKRNWVLKTLASAIVENDNHPSILDDYL